MNCRINIPINMTRKPPPRPMKRPAVILSTKKPTPIPIRSPAGIATPDMPHCFFVSSDCLDMLPSIRLDMIVCESPCSKPGVIIQLKHQAVKVKKGIFMANIIKNVDSSHL